MTQHNVLVVEDNHVQQRIITMILDILCCKVDVANTGAQALEFLATKNVYDFIFLDLGLYDIDGFKLAKIIRKKHKKTPIIALTAHSEGSTKSKCLEVGMSDFIQKPITTSIAKSMFAKYQTVVNDDFQVA